MGGNAHSPHSEPRASLETLPTELRQYIFNLALLPSKELRAENAFALLEKVSPTETSTPIAHERKTSLIVCPDEEETLYGFSTLRRSIQTAASLLALFPQEMQHVIHKHGLYLTLLFHSNSTRLESSCQSAHDAMMAYVRSQRKDLDAVSQNTVLREYFYQTRRWIAESLLRFSTLKHFAKDLAEGKMKSTKSYPLKQPSIFHREEEASLVTLWPPHAQGGARCSVVLKVVPDTLLWEELLKRSTCEESSMPCQGLINLHVSQRAMAVMEAYKTNSNKSTAKKEEFIET